jgi:hypothetical protein
MIFLIAVAAILGGVLGARVHKDTKSKSGTNSSSPNSSSFKSLSNIAVTGYEEGADYHIWLFYQGDDDYIRMSTFESTTGNWSGSEVLVKA